MNASCAWITAVDGSIRWQSGDVGATTVAVDAAGTVAAGAGDMVLRFDANGAPLPSWAGPRPIMQLLFDGTNQLVTTHLIPPEFGSRAVLDVHRFDPSGAATKVFTRASSAPTGLVAAGARLFYWGRLSATQYPSPPPFLELVALHPTGEVTWEVTEGYPLGFKGLMGGDLITPHAAACRGQTCAVSGSYEEPSATGMKNWVGVYAIP